MGLDPWQLLPVVRRSYSVQFFTALLAIALVVASFGGFIYVQTGETLQSDVREQLVTDAQKDADRLDSWFDSTERHVESLPRGTAFRSDDKAMISDALHRTTDRTAIAGAYYVDPGTGRVDVAAGDSEIVGDGRRMNGQLRDRIAAATADPNRVVFSEAFETADGRAAMLAVGAVPAREDRVVVGLIDLARLSEYMIGDTGNDVAVLDSGGTVVLATDRSRLLERDAFAPTDADDRGFTSLEGGTEVGYASLESAGLTLTIRVPASEAYSLQSDVSNQFATLLLVMVGAMLVFGVTIGRNTARSIRTLSERATAIEAGNLDEPLESNRRDEIGELYRSVNEMRASLRDRLEEVREARAAAEDARTEAERFSRRLERTADEYSETMRACADGDLTRRLETDVESDAMERIAREFNAMVDDLEATVGATRTFATTVEAASSSTADGVAEVRSASEQVTASVQEIADGAEYQSDRLAAVTQEVDDLSATTESIAATASQVATLAERSAETSERARRSARQAIDGVDAVQSEATAAVEAVESLETEMEQIDELLEFIGEVTDETNVLALNASIEASRSGESGDGFAAVAQQVKELAADTAAAADDVEERLHRVKCETERVAAVVRDTSEGLETHRSAVERTVDDLEEISNYAVETNDGVQEISAACQQNAGAARRVLEMVDDVTAISEETSAEAETVAAAAEEQTAALSDVTDNADLLSARARHLSALVRSFDVESDADDLPTPRQRDRVRVLRDDETGTQHDGVDDDRENDAGNEIRDGDEKYDDRFRFDAPRK